MCLVQVIRYTSCPPSHSFSFVAAEHVQAIYCSSQQVVVADVGGRCLSCTTEEVEEKASILAAPLDAGQRHIRSSGGSSSSMESR